MQNKPLSGSIIKKIINNIAKRPINGVTRSPHRQSDVFSATSEPKNRRSKFRAPPPKK